MMYWLPDRSRELNGRLYIGWELHGAICLCKKGAGSDEILIRFENVHEFETWVLELDDIVAKVKAGE